MFLLQLVRPSSIPSTTLPSWVTLDDSAPKPSSSMTSGGQVYLSLYPILSLDVPLANRTKPSHPTIPHLSPIVSTTKLPFKQLSVDLITDLPPSNGHDSLMVMVDHGLMKWVILAPCSKTIDANGVAQLFFDFVFKCFGLYDSIISDHGPQFMSAFARELARLLKYDIHLSSTYHPQMDGQTK